MYTQVLKPSVRGCLTPSNSPFVKGEDKIFPHFITPHECDSDHRHKEFHLKEIMDYMDYFSLENRDLSNTILAVKVRPEHLLNRC